MKIIGIGNDIIEIERIKNSIEKFGAAFINKILTASEQEIAHKFKSPANHMAGRFAAKEAVAKAIGTGFGKKLEWHDIEIINDSLGKPVCSLLRPEFSNYKIEISISHCHEYATATAIIFQSTEKS